MGFITGKRHTLSMNKSYLRYVIAIKVNFMDNKYRELSEYSGNIFYFCGLLLYGYC